MYQKVARIFTDVGGYYVCNERSPYFDTQGKAYKTKADAMRAALDQEYTHAVGSGTYWKGVKRIPGGKLWKN